MITLANNEYVVTVWAEAGWSNRPLWVLIRRDGTSDYRVKCLQPDEHPATAAYLYDISCQVNGKLRDAVEAQIRERTKVKRGRRRR